MKESIDFIYKQQKELSVMGGIGALLGWDQMTYMPKMGAIEKAEQSALLSKIAHEKVISDKFWNHITKLYEESNYKILSDKDKNVVKRLHKDVEKARRVPSEFVEKMSKTTTLAYQSWEKAREKNDFNVFSSDLKKIVELEKEYCSFFDIPGPKYNTLLDDYEEGMTVDKLRKEFSYLKKEIIQILEKIKDTNIFRNQREIDIKINSEEQKKLCNLVIKKMNLPGDKTRLDESTHPFTTSMGNNDVRITTSFKRKGPLFSFFSTIHEAGHALYELGMPQEDYKNTVISDSPSLGLHESQSRFWENMIARSTHFWNYFYPEFKKVSPKNFLDVDFDKWYRQVNIVRPSLIRVEADELTYPLHVILRFEIETDLIEGKIEVKDLPYIWKEKMDEMLGVVPKNDKEGVLQDMHWSGGNIGYFPTYVIGSIYSAQIYNQIKKENKNLESEIEKAEFKNILNWLRKNIHEKGRIKMADDIIRECCGDGLNSKIFVDYLKEKYYKIYS
jgi:carboxypeptidase Taq